METNSIKRLEGASAFRDLADGIAIGGRQLRAGRVFRSGHLADMTASDLEFVQTLGIRLICDLRHESEQVRHPTIWPERPSAVRLHLSVDADIQAGNQSLRGMLINEQTTQGARKMMLHTYQRLPVVFAGRLQRLFERIIDQQGLPLLIHCSAGKDRTGFVCAMLLYALGASDQTVMHDYLRTNDFFVPEQRAATLTELLTAASGSAPSAEIVNALMYVHQEYLEQALQKIASVHGGIDAYLERACGLTGNRRDSLREILLER